MLLMAFDNFYQARADEQTDGGGKDVAQGKNHHPDNDLPGRGVIAGCRSPWSDDQGRYQADEDSPCIRGEYQVEKNIENLFPTGFQD